MQWLRPVGGERKSPYFTRIISVSVSRYRCKLGVLELGEILRGKKKANFGKKKHFMSRTFSGEKILKNLLCFSVFRVKDFEIFLPEAASYPE